MEDAASSVCATSASAIARGRHKRKAKVADNHMIITETEIGLKNNTNANRSLFYMENLTLPSVQVVVMAANMQCYGCRTRVSRVLSKMTGLREYTVDVSKKEVIVKGDFMTQCKLQVENLRSSTLKSANDQSKSLLNCLTHSDKHCLLNKR